MPSSGKREMGRKGNGEVIDLIASLAHLLVVLVGREAAHRALDEAYIKMANEAADLAEKVKFGAK
jgi:hypothetical protein